MAAHKEDKDRIAYKVAEVARLLGVSRGLIYRLINDNELPAVALTPNLLLVRHRDVERLLQKKRA